MNWIGGRGKTRMPSERKLQRVSVNCSSHSSAVYINPYIYQGNVCVCLRISQDSVVRVITLLHARMLIMDAIQRGVSITF